MVESAIIEAESRGDDVVETLVKVLLLSIGNIEDVAVTAMESVNR